MRCDPCRGTGAVNRVVHTEGRTVVEVDPCPDCEALKRLANAMVDDIMSLSDGEVLAEFQADHGDPVKNAASMLALFEKAAASVPCPECGGSGVAHCCEGAREQPGDVSQGDEQCTG